MNQLSILLTAFVLSLSLVACQQLDLEKVIKFQESDPFKNGMPASQFFEVDNSIDQVIESEDGIIMVIPAHAFVDADGNTIKNVKVEITDALALEDMIAANLTTTSNGEALETGGMFYINATKTDGEQLKIQKGKSIHTKVPTANKKAGMQVYKGVRDADGKTNWIAPKPMPKYLQKIDLKNLDFRPKGFAEVVEGNMPYFGHTQADDALIDSLYYSFEGISYGELYKRYQGLNLNLDLNEGNRIRYNTSPKQTGAILPTTTTDYNNPYKSVLTQSPDYIESCLRIRPATIQTIKGDKFANTFLATKEFEARLRVIHEILSQEILEIYINNLDKNLWEADELAAKAFTKILARYDYDSSNTPNPFEDFAKEKLTTIENNSPHAAALSQYYTRQLDKNKKAIAKANEKLQKQLDRQNEAANKLVQEYEKLLFEREKYRMETYDYELTNLGWSNIDKPIPPSAPTKVTTSVTRIEQTQFQIEVPNQKNYERVYVYFVSEDIQSMHRMDLENGTFVTRQNTRAGMVIKPNTNFSFIAIGYQGKEVALSTHQLNTKKGGKIVANMTLKPSDRMRLNMEINRLDTHGYMNNIKKDLKYQARLFREQKRLDKLKDEKEFMQKMLYRVERCSE